MGYSLLNLLNLSLEVSLVYNLVSHTSTYFKPPPFKNEIPLLHPTISTHSNIVGSLQFVVIFVPLGLDLIM